MDLGFYGHNAAVAFILENRIATITKEGVVISDHDLANIVKEFLAFLKVHIPNLVEEAQEFAVLTREPSEPDSEAAPPSNNL